MKHLGRMLLHCRLNLIYLYDQRGNLISEFLKVLLLLSLLPLTLIDKLFNFIEKLLFFDLNCLRKLLKLPQPVCSLLFNIKHLLLKILFGCFYFLYAGCIEAQLVLNVLYYFFVFVLKDRHLFLSCLQEFSPGI